MVAFYLRCCQLPGSSAGIPPHLMTREPPLEARTEVRSGAKCQKSHFRGTELREKHRLLLCKRPSLTDDRGFGSEARSRGLEPGRLPRPLAPGSPSLCPHLHLNPGRPGLGLCPAGPAGCSPPSGHVHGHIMVKRPHRRRSRPYFDHQVSRRIPGHSGKFIGQLFERRTHVLIDHPAWTFRTQSTG